MKKTFIIIILLLPILLFADDTKIEDQTLMYDPSAVDRIPIIDDPNGTPLGRAITVWDLFNIMDASSELLAIMDDETGTGALVFGTAPTIDSPTFTTAFTATDLIDSDDYAADSIDNEHINWADIDYLTDEGAGIDEAYAAGWNGDVGPPEKDDIYDYLVSFDADADSSFTDETWYTNLLDGTATFTDLTGNDIIDSDNYAADSVDNEHINWGDIDYLNDEGEHSAFHLVGGTDTIFPADPDADRYLMWDDDPGELVWGSGGATAWDDIGNPDNSGTKTITFDNAEKTVFTGDNDEAGSFFTLQNSDADHTVGQFFLLDLYYSADDGDAEADFVRLRDSGGDVMTIQQNGEIATDGGITAGGTIEGATLTESSNAVPNVTDNLSVFAATTSAQLYGVLSDETGSGAGSPLAVFNQAPTIDSPTFTTAITATDLIDSAHYVADSIDNEHINWGDIDYLNDEGEHSAFHLVGGTDTIFPADPDADRYLMWDDDPGELVWGSGGATAWDDIGNPDNDKTIALGGYETTFTTSLDEASHAVMKISHTDSDVTNLTYLLAIGTAANDDTELYPFRIYDDSGGTPDIIFEVFSNIVNIGRDDNIAYLRIHDAGTILMYDDSDDFGVQIGPVTNGTETLPISGTLNPTTITENGNAVYNSSETPGGELGGTWANPTIDDSISVNSWTIDSPTFTTAITATDLIDSAHYVADSVDNEHINWADIDNLGDEGAITVADTTYAGCYVAMFEAATGDLAAKTDGALTYDASTGALTATSFSGDGSNLTSVDAATGDSATAFFDAGTIEHEYGGLQADVSGYTGLLAITGEDTTAEIDALSELIGQLADVTAFITDDDMPAAGTDPDVDAAGEIGRDTDGANETGDSSLRGYDGSAQFAYCQKVKTYCFAVNNPDGITSWTGRANPSQPVWLNTSGMTFTIIEVMAISDTDNYDCTLFESNSFTDVSDENDSSIVALECDADGTEGYTDTEVVSHAVEHDHWIIFEDTLGDAGGVTVVFKGWYGADVD